VQLELTFSFALACSTILIFLYDSLGFVIVRGEDAGIHDANTRSSAWTCRGRWVG
jgi:hypothetical protein